MLQSLRAEWPKGNNLHFLAAAPNLVSTPGVARVSLDRVKRARRLPLMPEAKSTDVLTGDLRVGVRLRTSLSNAALGTPRRLRTGS